MPKIERKIAEVAAFAVLGGELMDRSGTAGSRAFGEATAMLMTKTFKAQYDRAATKADVEKLQKTILKLRGMMETYIGDNWDDPTEILEWSGFFFGAAQVHWALVGGLIEDTAEARFANRQAEQFSAWLQISAKRIGQPAQSVTDQNQQVLHASA